MKMLVRSAAGGVVLLVGAVACTEKDRMDVFVGPNGGTGGSSSHAGASGSAGSGGGGGNAGSAGSDGGSAGSLDSGVPEAGTERFQAVLDGERVRLTALDPVWLSTCNEPNPRLVQRSGDAWTPLKDERPEAFNLLHAAHYLDGAFQSDCRLSLGCDVVYCTPLDEFEEDVGGFQQRMVAREYIQVGQLDARTCEQEEADADLDAGGDAGRRSVPAIESRAPTGPLAVRVRYYRDSGCLTGAITADIPVE